MTNDLTAGWNFDLDTMRQLRLEAAGRALAGMDPFRALSEAEELLQRHPGDIAALRLAGAAALSLGNGDMATAALDPVVAAAPDDASAWVQLGWARFLGGDIQGAVFALGEATRIAPADADAWYRLSVAAQWLDAAAGAAAALKAAELDGDAFPLAPVWAEAQWLTGLETALSRLESEAGEFYESVPVLWKARPEIEMLSRTQPAHPPLVFALASAEPPEAADLIESNGQLVDLTEVARRPEAVWLFRENIGRVPASADELADRIAQALATEANAWLEAESMLTQLMEDTAETE